MSAFFTNFVFFSLHFSFGKFSKARLIILCPKTKAVSATFPRVHHVGQLAKYPFLLSQVGCHPPQNPAPFRQSQDFCFLWKSQSNPRDALGEAGFLHSTTCFSKTFRIPNTNYEHTNENDKEQVSIYNLPNSCRYRGSIFNNYNGRAG